MAIKIPPSLRNKVSSRVSYRQFFQELEALSRPAISAFKPQCDQADEIPGGQNP
jgi:hypothetical protein